MTISSDDALQTHQREVQRLLGRCMLRLQQYERLLKVILAHHEISGSVDTFGTFKAGRPVDMARKTLGTLVGDLFGSNVVTNKIDAPVEEATSSPEEFISFGMRWQLNLTDEDFSQTKNEIEELVLMRNNLVHHFIDQYDIGRLEGCRTAQDALVSAYKRVSQHLEQLRSWAEGMEQSRAALADFIQTDAGKDLLLNGASPDGTVTWPTAGIIRALRDAASELAVNGWTPLAEASKWIVERHPAQQPMKYGCSSWRQVVLVSQVFELRFVETDGHRSACYREKDNIANKC